MQRLLRRAHTSQNDPELFAGLAHACRYCGLLQPSLTAHRQARRLDPNIATSVMHTYMMLGDYPSALDASGGDFGYGSAICLSMLGRIPEALEILKTKALPPSRRLGRLFMQSLCTLLEGDRAGSQRASDDLLGATFRDPEGLYYLARQLGYLGDSQRALPALARAIDSGFHCYPAFVRDPWLDPLRGQPEFTRILEHAQALHRDALNAYAAEGGASLLG
jgi:tetratricopeptide (TPR) repeat protein